MQEQRILHLENIQYRLRQFSIIVWIATIGVGLGVNSQGINSLFYNNVFLIGISSVVPILFMYVDAVYAVYAQKFRSRKNEVIDFLNQEDYVLPVSLNPKYIKRISGHENYIKFPVFDFHGNITLENDPQTIYRGNIFVKLTRKTRLLFYGFQMIGSSIILSHLLANQKDSFLYYLLIFGYFLLIGLLFLYRSKIKKRISKNLIPEYKRKLDERADKHNP